MLIFQLRDVSTCKCCNYRPQTKFAKVMFLQVSVCPQGGHAWLLAGGVCMVAPGGACVVAPGGACMVALGGCMVGCSQGGLGGMCGCSQGGHAWLLWGACMVAPGGHVWLLLGGACMVALGGHVWLLLGGHAWLLRGGMRGFFDEIRSMSGRYASYWNAFLFKFKNLQLLIFEYFNFSALIYVLQK